MTDHELGGGHLHPDSYLYAAVCARFRRCRGALSEVRPNDLAATGLTGPLAKAPNLASARTDENLVAGRAASAQAER